MKRIGLKGRLFGLALVPTAAGMIVSCGGVTAEEEPLGRASFAVVSQQTLSALSITLPNDLAPGDVAVGSSTELQIRDRARVISATSSAARAPLANAGSGVTYVGADASVGNLWSVGSVDLRNRAQIQGDLKTSGTVHLEPGATVTGTTAQNAALGVQRISAWTPALPAGPGGDVRLEPDQTRTIAPGKYGEVSIKSRSTLNLSPGTYYFTRLTLEPDSKIILSSTSAPTVIYLDQDFVFRGEVVDATNSSNQVLPLLVTTVGQNLVSIERPFRGTVFAPNARVNVIGGTHYASFFGREVELQPDAIVVHQAFPWSAVLPPPIPATRPRKLPAPPREIGCYQGTPNGWMSIPCTPHSERDTAFPNPDVTVQSITTAGATPPVIPFQFGQVETTFAAFGSVTDSLAGADSLSVQLNTNNFFSPSGDEGVVQFVLQTKAGRGNSLCVWNINYTQACAGIPKGSPCTNHDAYVEQCVGGGHNTDFLVKERAGGYKQFDYANIGGSTYKDSAGADVIGMVAQMSWFDPTDTSPGGSGLYAVVTPDTLGLHQGWTELSGTVFGLGGQSHATFTNTAVLNRLLAGSCVNSTGPDVDIPWPGVCPDQPELLPHTQIIDDVITAETSNLTGPAPLTLESATKDLVFTQYMTSTNSGGCVSDTARAFVRDSPSDTGVVPSNAGGEPFWESPDIFVVPEGSPVTVDGIAAEATMQPGATYDVYVRVNNDYGCTAVNGAKALIYLADPAALSTVWQPVTGGQYVADTSHPNGIQIPAGGKALIGPIKWTAPTSGLGDGHKCLLASVVSDVQGAPASTFDAPGSYQVAQRNVQLNQCSYPLVNATGGGGLLALTLSAEGAMPTLSGPNNIGMTFDDASSAWYNAWLPGAGSAYAVSHFGDKTTVRLGQRSVSLTPVSMASGQASTAQGVIVLGQGQNQTKLSIASTFVGTTGVVQNGGSCVANGPPVVK